MSNDDACLHDALLGHQPHEACFLDFDMHSHSTLDKDGKEGRPIAVAYVDRVADRFSASEKFCLDPSPIDFSVVQHTAVGASPPTTLYGARASSSSV